MMTDLHTHILPGIDDGAPDVDTALQLLEMEYIQGIHNVALTSHYNPDDMSIDVFIEKRAHSFSGLCDAAKAAGTSLNLKLGSEVYFSPNLLQMDVYPLCLEGTDILLLELPMNHQPQFFKEALMYFQSEGIIPLIAHVERYPYVMRDPDVLTEWIEMGAYAQINASAFLHNGRRKKLAFRLLKCGLAHVVSSDTHSPDKRPPRIKEAMRVIEKQFGNQTVYQLQHNADALFMGQEPESTTIYYPRKFFARWL